MRASKVIPKAAKWTCDLMEKAISICLIFPIMLVTTIFVNYLLGKWVVVGVGEVFNALYGFFVAENSGDVSGKATATELYVDELGNYFLRNYREQ